MSTCTLPSASDTDRGRGSTGRKPFLHEIAPDKVCG